jgi:hypothetical protein
VKQLHGVVHTTNDDQFDSFIVSFRYTFANVEHLWLSILFVHYHCHVLKALVIQTISNGKLSAIFI